MDENQFFYKETDENNKNSIFKRKLALLDLLIAASLNDNQLDEEGIREEVDTFMLAGHDTTAMALCFALLLFAKHKDVQERIRNEVKTVIQQYDCKPTISMLQEFSYLERCLKESLRLYPSVHFIARYLSQDLQYPNIWKNPDVFDADRFLSENTKGRNPYSFIPFSAGPRNCIGQKFAMFQFKLMAAYILYNFYLEPVDELDEVKMIGDITLCSPKPLLVEFVVRK